MKAEVADSGMDIISLGIGDPDLPTPGHIIEELDVASRKLTNHQYPSLRGHAVLTARPWRTGTARASGVALDPASEVISLIGSERGASRISHLRS